MRGLDPHAGCDVDERAQVIEIRMGDEERFDDSAAFRDPWNQRPRRDIAHRARSPVEEHEQTARFDADRRAIANGEHGAREASALGGVRHPSGRLAHADSSSDARDHEPSRPPQHSGWPDDGRHDRRAQHGAGKRRQCSDGDASRTRIGCNLDEPDLKPRGHPDDRTKRSGQRRRDRPDDRLWIGDHERQRGEGRAQEREQDSERLQGSEMHQNDRSADQEGSESRSQCLHEKLACDSHQDRHPEARVVARNPPKPADGDGRGEMP